MTIAKDVADNVCHGLGTLLDPFTCAIVNRTEIIANPAIDDLKGKIKGANDALADIQNNQIKGANDALKQAESELSALDDKLQAVQKELERGVLQKSIRTGPSTHLELENKVLQRARDGVVALKLIFNSDGPSVGRKSLILLERAGDFVKM